ncbi:MAG: FAD:protein FMN transferase [Bullifex sp.]
MNRLLTISVLIITLLTSCTRLSYPEYTETLFGGDVSIILTEGGDDGILEDTFILLESLEGDGAFSDELLSRVNAAAELTGVFPQITDTIIRSHAAQRAAQYLMERGVTGGAVSVAGCVYVIGTHPDGGAWRVAIADPVEGRGESYATVDSPQGAVITSSGCHESDLLSVTVLAKDAVLAAVVSDAALKRGRAEGEELLKRLGLHAVMLSSDDGIIRI